jgi:hypothetical protein
MRQSPTHIEISEKTVGDVSRHRSSSGQHRRSAQPRPARTPGAHRRSADSDVAATQRVVTARSHARAARAPLHRAKVTRVAIRAPRFAVRPVARVVRPVGQAALQLSRRARPVLGRLGPALRRPRLAVAAAVLGCLALASAAQGVNHSPSAFAVDPARSAVRPVSDEASRSSPRVGTTPASTVGGAVADARVRVDGAPQADATAAAATATAAAKAAAAAQAAEAAKAAALAKWKADNPMPVAGLTQIQMNNALRIVGEGKALGLPKRAYVLAVACAMQESNLTNLASNVLPESFNYPHEGAGADHDSVGLFQQRPSSGWGSVKDLMTPAYAAKQFYDALVSIAGWQSMALTYAIQAVQVSAYPDAYAPHEWAAQTVVDALTG